MHLLRIVRQLGKADSHFSIVELGVNISHEDITANPESYWL